MSTTTARLQNFNAPPHAGPAAKAPRQGLSFGKYREIIIAVALFLLFDLGVLILNFYTSYQIAEDAVGVNLSGRQRMLSQRTAKALLAVETARQKNTPSDSDLMELSKAVALFDTSLKGFQHGATVPGGDGKPVYLPAAQGQVATDVLARAQALWTPYQAALAPVLAGSPSDAQLDAAVNYARQNNLKLLGLMNDLTTALEQVASSRASTLRLVQTVGIALALLNFVFILFKFLKRLRTSDAAVEAITEENREILTSVREGLFLLTPDNKLGTQLSASTHALFGKQLAPGQDFFDVLGTVVSSKVLADGRDYVELLFSPHVKEQLVQGINPLLEVQVSVKNRLGQATERHLSFHFNRVMDGAVVRHLLVTVQNISQRMALQAQLANERERSHKEFSLLLKAFETDAALMRGFVDRSEASLLEINDLLRSISSASSEAAVMKSVDGAFRRIHAIKGDAGALGLDVLATLAHQFEAQLQKLKDTGAGAGDALLALPLPLEELLSKIGSLKKMSVSRASTGQTGPASLPAAHDLNDTLTQLARTVGHDCGKAVNAQVDISSLLDMPPAQMNAVREIAIQLVRNAVVHGIETPAARTAAHKPAEGAISVHLTRDDSREWVLSVRDDGMGLDPARVRAKLVALGWYTPPQLESFDDRQILAHIFKPGFSTEDVAGLHAGRGVGLDLVQHHVRQLGGRMLMSSTCGQFTEFRIKLTA